MSAITMVMPCYNRAHDLPRVLKAYDSQNVNQPFEIIAIDDASTDATYEILTSYCPVHYTLQVKHQDKNQGPAAARNQGIALAQSPLIMFVGDDIVPNPDLVQAHLAAHNDYPEPNITILGRVVWPPDIPQNTLMKHIDGVGAQQFSYFYLQDKQEYDFRHFYTSNVSLKTTFLRQIDSWFDTHFPYAAVEDAELAYRMAQRGLRIIYHKQLIGYHYHYHTIWTFSVRQYRAGLMVNEIVNKHPELGNFFRVTKTRYLLILGVLQRLSLNSLHLPEVAHWLEEQALRLTSSYEWTPHPLLDELYSGVLEYFWRKGLIDGVFQNSSYREDIRNTYTVYYLKNRLINFLQKAKRLNIPVSIADQNTLEQKLAQVESPAIKYLLAFWQTSGYRLVKPWLYPQALPI